MTLITIALWMAASAAVAQLANTKIAFVSARDGNNEIYIVAPDGTGLTNLTQRPARDSSPNWSPDGTKIAFESDRDGAASDIFVMDADGLNPTNVTLDFVEDAWSPAWSPDGTKIAFHVNFAGVYVINADGTSPTPLMSGEDARAASWSPDGTTIAYQLLGDIYTINIGTMPYLVTQLTSDPANEGSPEWSPDGSKVAYLRDVAGKDAVYTIDITTLAETNVSQVPLEHSGNPDWAPDGSAFVFTRGSGAPSDIWTMDMSGTNQAPIPAPANSESYDDLADWSPFLTTVAPDPTVGIASPAEGQQLAVGTTSAPVTVAITDHPSPGHWHWQLGAPFPDTGVAAGTHVPAGTLTDTITGLVDGGSYTVYVALVADDIDTLVDAAANPGARASVSFTVGASGTPPADAVTAVDAQGAAGTVVVVPIDLYDISATAGVTAVDLSLTFDVTLLTPVTDGVNTTAATLGPVVPVGWSVEQFASATGQLNISLASAFGDALFAGGTVVNVAFDVSQTAAANATSVLDLTKADLNEGAIPATPVDGTFTVLNLLYGDVTGNGVVSAYDASWVLEYVVNAALTPPIIIQFPIETAAPTWGVLPLAPADAFDVADVDQDVAIAAMDASYILRAAVGMITLPVAPAASPSIAASPSDYRLTASATSERPGARITVTLDASTMADLYAGEIVLAFDPTLLRPTAVSLRRNGPADERARPLLAHRERDGQLAVAFASARAIDASAAILDVTFEASRSVPRGVASTVEASHLRLNGSRVETDFAFPFRVEPFANRLMANYPNPFNPETWIPFELAADAEVTICVYDLHGSRVRTLDLGARPTGEHRSREDAAYWDGRNARGERVASGVYVYELTAGDYRAARRMVVRK